MTQTTAPPTAAAPSTNGTGPAPAAGPGDCPECVSKGEKLLAVFGLAVAAGIGFMAVDMLTGYRLSRLLLGRPAEPAEGQEGASGDGDG